MRGIKLFHGGLRKRVAPRSIILPQKNRDRKEFLLFAFFAGKYPCVTTAILNFHYELLSKMTGRPSCRAFSRALDALDETKFLEIDPAVG